jgi:peptide/nickel transport system permease protein
MGVAGLVLLLLIMLGILFVPVLSPFTYKAQNINQTYAPAGTVSVDAGLDVKAGHVYWLGSDDYGRDVLTRLFYGGRTTLSVALLATVLVVLIGSIVGALAGYFGGAVDTVFMRFTDLMLALPLLPTFLLLTRIFPVGAQYTWADGDWFMTTEQALKATFGYSLIFVVFGWMPLSRQVRASMMHLKTLEFVEASRALGAGGWRLATRHLVPNSLGVIVLVAVLTVGEFIIYESILSYLGMGVGQPIPTWGNMIRDAQSQMWFITNTINPTEDIRGFLLFLPGLMIFSTVSAINLVGEGLRDAFLPR